MKKSAWFSVFLLMLAAGGCSPANPSLYKYTFNPEYAIRTQDDTKVFIAPFNTMIKQDFSPAATLPVSTRFAEYFAEHNIQVLPQEQFTASWRVSNELVGGYYDQETGEFLIDNFKECIRLTLEDLNGDIDFSYVVFPDLVERTVAIHPSSGKAEWDGVGRQLPREKEFKTGWTEAQAASLYVYVVTRDNETFFGSIGGMDFLQVSTKKGDDYVLAFKENPFDNQENLTEGIQIALYPFVYFEGYPEK